MRSQPPGPPPAPSPFEPCPYAINDGAYILGALAPAERADFERHLAACPPCRDSMTHLAVLPGLLGRLDPQTAAKRTTPAPATLLPRVLTTLRARRAAARRRRRLAVVAGVVAALALGAAVGVGVPLTRPAPPGPFIYRPMVVDDGGPPVDVQIGLQEQPIGTVVAVRCLYHGQTDRNWLIWLVVYPRDEDAEPIGSWVAPGGESVEVTAITHHPADEIARIELQTPSHATIAWWTP